MQTDGDSEGNARAFRLDLVIAVCALLVSTLATAASWWQTRVIAQQLSAQVWPYVSISGTSSSGLIELDIVNDGLGPAVIKSFVLDVDGKPQRDVIAALGALGIHGSARPAKTEFLFGNVVPSEVIRPSTSLPFFRARGTGPIPAALARQAGRLRMELCYCSILATCWDVVSPGHREPAQVGACPDRTPDQLRDVTAAEASRF